MIAATWKVYSGSAFVMRTTRERDEDVGGRSRWSGGGG
jgi:hypothetical protein